MVRSAFCSLYELSERELYELNECPLDMVRIV